MGPVLLGSPEQLPTKAGAVWARRRGWRWAVAAAFEAALGGTDALGTETWGRGHLGGNSGPGWNQG